MFFYDFSCPKLRHWQLTAMRESIRKKNPGNAQTHCTHKLAERRRRAETNLVTEIKIKHPWECKTTPRGMVILFSNRCEA